ncbi:MAG: sensor histidine kinase [Hyphomonadaceae bacterium]
MTIEDPDARRWMRRPETLAVGASILFLAAGVTAAMNAPYVAVVFAALGITLSMLVWLAVRMERTEADAALDAAKQAELRALAIASHDLRQPLHAITLYLNALDKRVDGEEARAILSKVERAADNMSGLLTGLMDYARLRRGARQLASTEAALKPLLARAAAGASAAIVEAPDIVVRTDVDLLTETLAALVTNAQTHGGGLTRIDAQQSDGALKILVADAGPGVPPEHHADMFEPFVRLEHGKTRPGLGLGLAYARESARLLGGRLSIASAPGEGARFILTLPSAI